jgi:catechol 2,3-dioxygenase-like lactoylglutathione lyase family enzyme
MLLSQFAQLEVQVSVEDCCASVLLHQDTFGFRLVSPGDIDAAVEEVERAGGKLRQRGEFCPGCPYAYVTDPDGYEVEIWYE